MERYPRDAVAIYRRTAPSDNARPLIGPKLRNHRDITRDTSEQNPNDWLDKPNERRARRSLLLIRQDRPLHHGDSRGIFENASVFSVLRKRLNRTRASRLTIISTRVFTARVVGWDFFSSRGNDISRLFAMSIECRSTISRGGYPEPRGYRRNCRP